MNKIVVYLTFNGNCTEAMRFYQKCLGGKLQIQRLGESPASNQLPNSLNQYVLQANLCNGSVEIIGTDLVSDEGLQRGNSVAMMLVCKSKREMNQYFKKLAIGGKVLSPVQRNFFGVWFGTLQDRYENYWLMQYV
ncbi:MAG TPA: VOC family protein [Cyclobacteriaceae bacterium]|jgi:PhnB protein|nr:VOC family protein [Cytophagales bacterium]HCR53395.1 VOC family protein [Cytophagales bacterium]HMR57329.1 VOC family protein [Cyclobacteriaceae bacterium]HNT51633.1 VOC family protein [Cyclobacteriaceae bacterium]HRF32709.1 VOC family protein [Cyclobacteriaceae bacterium]